MHESNDDIARRVLASVLERLEASAGSRSRQGAASGVDHASLSFSGNDPLVVVVLGGVATKSADPGRTPNDASLSHAANGSQSISGNPSHPGLEKFDVPKPGPNTHFPKTCFMEPDRPCVNSGACEMRGY
jgi:hypothetical protein